MDKKGQKGIVGLIVLIVIAVAAALTIFIDLAQTQQTLVVVTNETITLGGANTSAILDNVKVQAGTDVLSNPANAALTRDTNYSITNDVARVTNTNLATGNFNMSYSFQPAGFATGGTTRTILTLVPLLFAVVIIVFIGRRMLEN